MLDITMEGLGVNSRHGPGYFFDYKGESRGFWLLMCFRTPFVVRTGQGLEQGRPGDCILHDPTAILYHGPVPGMTGGFANDWIYFRGTDADRLISQLEIPCNRILPGMSVSLLSPFITRILRERQQRGPFWNEASALSAAEMLIELRRSITGQDRQDSAYQALLDVRQQVTERFEEVWSLAAMAKLAGFSVSRFTVLYRKYFGTSPIRDLTAVRIAHSKNMLLSGGKTVSQVAAASGFSSLYYYSRVFKRLEGKSPMQYLRGDH